MFEWHKHLCDYYKVTPEQALELGTRSSGRKPSLPGSQTCEPVSGKTFEDIWDQKERKDEQSIFDFYKDQGAWSAFRQCVRHKDLEGLHMSYLRFVTTFLKYLDEESSKNLDVEITIVDVDCEHLNFAKYRLNEIKKSKNMTNLKLNFETVEPKKLPTFNNKLDALFCFCQRYKKYKSINEAWWYIH